MLSWLLFVHKVIATMAWGQLNGKWTTGCVAICGSKISPRMKWPDILYCIIKNS